MEEKESIYFVYKHGKHPNPNGEEPRKILVSQEEWERDWLNWWRALERQKEHES